MLKKLNNSFFVNLLNDKVKAKSPIQQLFLQKNSLNNRKKILQYYNYSSIICVKLIFNK